MSIISEDGGAVNLPVDLLKDASTPDTQKNYFEVTITDLNVNTTYPLQFAWVYEDRSVSEYSATYNVTTASEVAPIGPSTPILTWGNGLLSIEWNGLDSAGNQLLNYKQVNVWIRGGSYGATSVKTAEFFTTNSIKSIPLGPGTYNVKLQAESALGVLSAFSAEASTVSYKPPSPVTGVTGTWVKDDGTTKTDTLRIGFTFDTAAAETATNSNAYADYFKITLTANSRSRIFYSPVNKASSAQVFYLSAAENKAAFGLFATSFSIQIQVVDSFGNTSTVVPATSLTYTTPLSVPVISVTPDILGYSVSYTSPAADLPFDQIYIYESVGGGPYTQVAQGKSNPLIVSTTNTSTRSVKAIFYDSNGLATTDSNIVTNVTPLAAFSADNIAPNAPSAGLTATSGIDSTGTLGFNGFINLSWTAVSDATLRGYRIRFRPVTTPTASNYSYVDIPTGTTYRLAGLAVGTTYEVGIASYDEFNNTSSTYTSFTNQTISGTPFIGTNVTTTGYFGASAGGETGEFRFGYGVATGRRGLVFNADNYWYIDSAASATFKLGGSSQNYVQWDGQAFTVDGDITARRGTFSGNVTLASGGSLQSFTTAPTTYNITAVSFTATTATYTTSLAHGYAVGTRVLVSGLAPAGYNGMFTVTASTTNTFTVANATNTAVTDQSGFVIRVTGAGFVLSKDGLKFNSSTTQDITTIDAATGKLTTSSATIGGWDVTTSTISKNGITLNSTGTIIANNGAYYVGIKPQVSTATDIVLWAGQSADGSAANFRVDAGGKLTASGASITGDIVITGGSTLTAINQANSNASSAVSAVATKLNTAAAGIIASDNNITAINAGGIQIFAGSYNPASSSYTGAAIVMNSAGITAKNASGVNTFAISSSTGNAEFLGTITSTAGNIAGWTIGPDRINKGDTWISSGEGNGYISIGTSNGSYVKMSGAGIQVGNTTFASAPFRVDMAGKVTASSFELNAGTDFIKSDGTFKLGAGKIDYGVTTAGTLTIKNTKFFLNVTSNEDNTFGDSTVVQAATNQELTVGRAFFYGGFSAPGSTTNRPPTQGGGAAFNKGDIWFQREA